VNKIKFAVVNHNGKQLVAAEANFML